MPQGKYVNINGLEVYCETHGIGLPLVLLHGGLATIDDFGPLLPALAKGRQVIAIELEGHGRTAMLDRPFSFQQMADDIAGLIKQLGFKSADLVGYSLGGATALHTASRHADIVRKLALVSTPFKSDGWFPEVHAGMQSMNEGAAKMMVGSPPHQSYTRVAPMPENWPSLVAKTGELIRQDYDWSDAVAAIKATTMLAFADADAVRPEHIVEFFKLLGGGKEDAGWDGSKMPKARLAILPGKTHYNIFTSLELASALIPFFDEP